MIKCRDVVEASTDARENALEGWRRIGYRAHLLVCPFCRAHQAQVDTTISTLRSLPKEGPSDAAREQALAAFRNRKRGT